MIFIWHAFVCDPSGLRKIKELNLCNARNSPLFFSQLDKSHLVALDNLQCISGNYHVGFKEWTLSRRVHYQSIMLRIGPMVRNDKHLD